MSIAQAVDKLVADNNGRYVEREDATNVNQCFDLAFAYTDLLGIPRAAIRHLYAYQIFTNPTQLTYQHFHLLNSNPQKGDIIVYGNVVGPAGHVDIFLEGTLQRFTAFSQNWPAGSPARVIQHSAWGVIGILRFKGEDMDKDKRIQELEAYVKQNADIAELRRKNFDIICAALGVTNNGDEVAVTKVLVQKVQTLMANQVDAEFEPLQVFVRKK